MFRTILRLRGASLRSDRELAVMMSYLFAGAVWAALVGVMVIVGLVLGHLRQRLRERLQASFDDRIHQLARTFSMCLVTPSMAQGGAEREGVSVIVDLTRGAHGLPPVLRVRVPFIARRGDPTFAAKHGVVSSGPAGMSFRLRTLADRLGQSIGLVRGLKTGDASFDERVIVDSDAPADTIALILRSPAARSSIARVLDAGVLRVDLLMGAVEIVALRRHPTAEHADAALSVGHELATIVATLPAFSTDPVQRPNGLRGGWVPIGATALATFAFFVALEARERFPSVRALSTSAVVEAALVTRVVTSLVAFFLVRGKTHALRNFGFTVLVLFPTSFVLPYCAEMVRLLVFGNA